MLYFFYFKPLNSFSPCNFSEEKKMTETIKSNIKKLNKKNFWIFMTASSKNYESNIIIPNPLTSAFIDSIENICPLTMVS